MSKHYERERQVGWFETLLPQVQALEGQVLRLAADYRQLAALLRGG